MLTRRGTWLEAVCFYGEHFAPLKQYIMQFSTNEAQSILNVQSLFNNEIVAQQISFIKSNYDIIGNTITELESNKKSF